MNMFAAAKLVSRIVVGFSFVALHLAIVEREDAPPLWVANLVAITGIVLLVQAAEQILGVFASRRPRS